MILPTDLEDQDLERLQQATEIPLRVLLYLKKKGFSPIPTEVARAHGLLG